MTEPSIALGEDAARLDAADPLARFADAFVPADGLGAYLDGNSLGRPMRATQQRLASFVAHDWGTRLIRSWEEQWMDLPTTLGDRLGRTVLGAAEGQTIVADSTTVLLYKALRAAVALRPGRSTIVIDTDNFPTDRFIAEGVAAELGLHVRWVEADPAGGVTTAALAPLLSDDTAVVMLSHVAYKSGYLADAAALTDSIHAAGALALWDLCHSAGVVPTELDAWGVDFAVGCTYKYLNGGPGSPAFLYVRHAVLAHAQQPIWGWMGAADVFAMAAEYAPSPGIRQFLSGTPPVLGMLPMHDMLDAIEAAGMPAIRAKSVALTEFAWRASESLLVPLGVRFASPRDSAERGGHLTLAHPSFKEVPTRLWGEGIIPDFRHPDGLRIGLSPLSTTFAETLRGVEAIAAALR